jgi:hypothetical protein
MKYPGKPNFMKKEKVFVLGGRTKRERMIIPSQDHSGARKMVSSYRTSIPLLIGKD